MFAKVGLNKKLIAVDDSVRDSYFPFGFSGMMLGASLVFFAFIGFDSISTHSEEAIRPQRDVPIGILASLLLCTLLLCRGGGDHTRHGALPVHRSPRRPSPRHFADRARHGRQQCCTIPPG